MKKWFSILLAMLLLCLPAAAVAGEGDPTPPPAAEGPEYEPLPEEYLPLSRRVLGDWYGDYAGIVFSLSFLEDGSYAAVFPGWEPQTGKWALEDGYIVLDGNSQNGILPVNGVLSWEAAGLLLTREKPQGYVPADVLADAKEGSFDGLWRSRFTAAGEGTVYADALGEDAYVYIEGTNVALGGKRFGRVIKQFTFSPGALTLAEEGLNVTIELQKDGFLRLTAPDAVIYLRPAPMPGTEPKSP